MQSGPGPQSFGLAHLPEEASRRRRRPRASSPRPSPARGPCPGARPGTPRRPSSPRSRGSLPGAGTRLPRPLAPTPQGAPPRLRVTRLRRPWQPPVVSEAGFPPSFYIYAYTCLARGALLRLLGRRRGGLGVDRGGRRGLHHHGHLVSAHRCPSHKVSRAARRESDGGACASSTATKTTHAMRVHLVSACMPTQPPSHPANHSFISHSRHLQSPSACLPACLPAGGRAGGQAGRRARSRHTRMDERMHTCTYACPCIHVLALPETDTAYTP